MPSPSTPQRTSKRRVTKSTPSKPKPADVGIPLGPYDTNCVRERVRQWQAQGGGVITSSEFDVEEDRQKDRPCKDQESGVESTFPNSGKIAVDDREESRSDLGRKRDSRRASRLDEEVRDRKRSASAPKKRVISDAHWRKTRSPPRSATSSQAGKEPTPIKIFPEDGIRVKPLPDPKSEIRRKGDSEQIGGNNHDDDGIRVCSTAPESGKQSGRLQALASGKSGSKNEDNNEQEYIGPDCPPSSLKKRGPIQRSKKATRDKSPGLNSESPETDSRKPKITRERKTKSDKSPLSAQSAFSGVRGSAKSHTVNILSQVFDEPKKIFSKAEPVALQSQRIPSVEAWLEETPDPFVDAEEPPVEIPLPLKSSSKRKEEERVSIRNENTIMSPDPNQIWDSVESKQRRKDDRPGSKRSRRVPSSTLYEGSPFPKSVTSGSPLDSSDLGGMSAARFVDLVHDAHEVSPPSLRRRGARKNTLPSSKERRKSSPLKESVFEEDKASIESPPSVSSVEPLSPAPQLRPPGLNVKRPFPSTGRHRLSTIASVETFNTQAQNAAPSLLSGISESTVQPETDPEARDQFDQEGLLRMPSKSRLTKHADLISVLSLPRATSKSIQSARSIRTNRSRLATATITDLMKELDVDESKYMRELRTLVDGVIPVLLTCVLSKTDSAVAAGLFRPSANARDDPNFTQPIVDMGIALERLKTLHKRIPHQDPDALLTWAQGAQKVYSEYLKAWRMGFQDVVVNLAPSAEDEKRKSPNAHADGLDEGLPRNKDGDVVNGNGERVDVAFLLKRPLVRLKYLAKTLKGINILKPSVEAETLAFKFQNLVIDARHRLNEERARLEDEAASAIDPTRARDLRTLAPLAGITIDRTRRVRARDYFNLTLQHSTGQRVDCRIELLLRDDTPDRGSSGDLLICEVDGTGRWLLLPPVQAGRISVRNGDLKGEIVVMIRGLQSNGQEWHELLILQTEDEQTGFEWVQMLGLTPVPPQITRTQSFIDRQRKSKIASASAPGIQAPEMPTTPGKSRTPSPREVEIPIGEQVLSPSKIRAESPARLQQPLPPLPSPKKERARLQKKSPDSYIPSPAKALADSLAESNDLHSLPSQNLARPSSSPIAIHTPRSLNEALGLVGSSSVSGLRRAKAKRLSKYGNESPTSPKSARSSYIEDHPQEPTTKTVESPSLEKAYPFPHRQGSPEPLKTENLSIDEPKPGKKANQHRPSYHRSRSSVPSLELPIIPKVRKDSPPTTPTHDPFEEPEWPAAATTELLPPRTPPKSSKQREDRVSPRSEESPRTPPHRSPSPAQSKDFETPILSATAVQEKRRSSSPLKHQYEPSTASESSSDSDASTVEHNDVVSVSDSSEDEELEDGDAPTPLLPLGFLQRYPKASPQGSIYSLPNGTLSPSQSASQAPYKTVPAQPNKATKTIASIFFWSDAGSWQSLHPDECSIVITPGLIQAFEMSAAHSIADHLRCPTSTEPDHTSNISSISASRADEASHERPLVALELTPLVPIRRGTALDISIRSPPTPSSKITSGNNIMFRSRNPEECEALYALINHSRINNPTYIALQNARGPYSQSSFSSMDRSRSIANQGLRSSSWFGFGGSGRSSYRASSAPTPSIAPSESSIGSMTSAFSALKRFGKGGNRFSISRSTVTSRNGSRANSIYTSSDNSSGSGTSSPIPSNIPGTEDGKAAPIGLSNAKIRIYIRETASKWRDMGSARLTIMKPTTNNTPAGTLSPSTATRPNQRNQNEKRIVITGKTKGETLLDVTLGESCFERVARTGIALSVWEDFEGGTVAASGGVGPGRASVYMIQVSRVKNYGRSFFFQWMQLADEGSLCVVDERRSGNGIYFFYRGEVEVLSSISGYIFFGVRYELLLLRDGGILALVGSEGSCWSYNF
ncbi:hypothetical protein MMC06_001367 [Schaereria dolodes]|nr:hypothetical protein [Schaereria dolodes]